MNRLVQAENLEQMIHIQTQAEVDGWESRTRYTSGFGGMVVNRCVEVDKESFILPWLRVTTGIFTVDLAPLHSVIDKRNPGLNVGFVAIRSGGLEISRDLHKVSQTKSGFQIKSYRVPDEDIVINYTQALRLIEPKANKRPGAVRQMKTRTMNHIFQSATTVKVGKYL